MAVSVVAVVPVGIVVMVGLTGEGARVAVGEAGCPAQAAVNNTRVDAPNKNRREIFFISFSLLKILHKHDYACLR